MRRTLTALALAAGLGLAAAPAPAVVPPKDCGTLRVKGKRYNVKADQLRCSTAKRYTTHYLGHRTKPKGFTCARYRRTKLVFRCFRGRQNFFAIKR